jgi:hypothetical protein
MDSNTKIEIITNYLILQKRKQELELERFINSGVSIDELCSGVEERLDKYRASTANISLWLEMVGSNNNPEGDNN